MDRGSWRTVGARIAWSVAVATMWSAGAAYANEGSGFGQLPVRNFQPIQMLVLGMFGDRASVLGQGELDVRIELAETNSIFREETNPPLFTLTRTTVKFETLRTGVFLRYGLTKRFEVGLELPVLYRYRGIMEGAITAVERATTGLTTPRTQTQGLGYAFHISREGRTLFEGGAGNLGLGDMTLVGKYELLERHDRQPGVAFRTAIKLPTGDSGRTFGSGRTDLGIGLAIEQAIAERWMTYTNFNGVFPTGDVAGLDLRPTFSSLAAVEYLWSTRFSLIAQFQYYSSPFHDTGLKVLDRGVTETAMGFNYKLRPNLLWQTYGVENLDFITGAAADFTFSTVMTYQFGR